VATTDSEPTLHKAAAHRACAVAVAAEAVADSPRSRAMQRTEPHKMGSASGVLLGMSVAAIFITAASLPAAEVSNKAPELFNTPQQAADAMIGAADKFDVAALINLVGSDSEDILFSGEVTRDKQRAKEFATQALQKRDVVVDPKTNNSATLIVGNDAWPFPLPIVKRGNKWAFDAPAGREAILYRRIGSNELDAINICRGFVEAQYEYAFRKRSGYEVNQFAQQIISSPGKQDGLAWKNADGTWDGPVGEKVARAIEQGYTSKAEPYHGYFFKILKGQGPDAPHGAMDFVVNGVMIGGFALAAAPAEYGEMGIKTFMVSHDGIVYEKDLGTASLESFQKLELFNPDKSWTVVP
jgi:hypothetical protein